MVQLVTIKLSRSWYDGDITLAQVSSRVEDVVLPIGKRNVKGTKPKLKKLLPTSLGLEDTTSKQADL